MSNSDQKLEFVLSSMSNLTPREKSAVRHVLSGHTCKEAARAEGKSYRTIEVQRSSAYLKLGISGASELFGIALALAERGIKLSERL